MVFEARKTFYITQICFIRSRITVTVMTQNYVKSLLVNTIPHHEVTHTHMHSQRDTLSRENQSFQLVSDSASGIIYSFFILSRPKQSQSVVSLPSSFSYILYFMHWLFSSHVCSHFFSCESAVLIPPMIIKISWHSPINPQPRFRDHNYFSFSVFPIVIFKAHRSR